MKLGRNLLFPLLLGLFAFAQITPSSAVGSAQSSKPSAKQQVLTWSWGDTNERGNREFAEEEYWSVEDIPVIELKISPVNPSRRVLLERFNDVDQSWEVIAEERTNSKGEAIIFIGPDCQDISDYADGSWCDYSETLRLRVLKALGQKQRISQSFEVTYVSSEDDWSSDSDEDWDD